MTKTAPILQVSVIRCAASGKYSFDYKLPDRIGAVIACPSCGKSVQLRKHMNTPMHAQIPAHRRAALGGAK